MKQKGKSKMKNTNTNDKMKKEMEMLKQRTIESAHSLSLENTFDLAKWQKLNKDTIREYLIIAFDLKSNPSKNTQLGLIDEMTDEQEKELSGIIKYIDLQMKLGLTSSKYILQYK